MRIKVIKAPPGQAPQWVRDAWVGIELSVATDEVIGIQTGIYGGAPENMGGFRIEGKEAFLALRSHNPRAHNWWRHNVPTAFFNVLVFARDACEIVKE